MDYRIWDETQAIIRANPKLHRSSEFYRWMREMFVSGVAMSVRRLTDSDTRAISFFRFLKLVKGNASLVSRQRYRKLYRDDDVFSQQLRELGIMTDHVKAEYEMLVGPGKEQPSPDDIQRELDAMQQLTSKIVALADSSIAHHEEKKPEDLPTFADVDKAISFFEELLKRYRLLFDATSMSTDITFQYDWKAIFRVPWIP